MPVPYYRLVFTLPAAVAEIACHSKAAVYDLLFKASSETLITIAADPRSLDARVGALSVLNTWRSAPTPISQRIHGVSGAVALGRMDRPRHACMSAD
ncbi:MAG: hypothetical protein ACLPGW_15155 [Roseiarcus sp.]